MEKEKLLTIIVPMYNRMATIERCLDSIGCQEAIGHCQLIVVDNNSTDASAEIVNQWEQNNRQVALHTVNECRQGASAARNTGLSLVETPYTMFFDSDDEMLPGHIARLIKAINRNHDTDVFGWDIECELSDGRSYRGQFGTSDALRDNLIDSTFSTQRYAARTSLFRMAGGWNEWLRGWVDFELGTRIALCQPKIMKLPDPATGPLVKTYFSEDSITGKSFSTDTTKWESALDRIEAAIAAKEPEALRYVAYRRAVLAGYYAREGALAEAQRLLAQATAKGFGRKKARAVYETARLLGKGTRLIGRVLL